MAGSNVGRVLTRRPDLRLVRGLAGSALVLNVLLVVSGGAVRLTDSGLGCPTWPRCSAGSLTVTPALGIHGGIEFGNRLLGVVLEIVGIGLLAAVCVARPRMPRSWRWLAAVQALVVPVQAVVGGVLVLTELNPYVRALDFLVSFPPRPHPGEIALRGPRHLPLRVTRSTVYRAIVRAGSRALQYRLYQPNPDRKAGSGL